MMNISCLILLLSVAAANGGPTGRIVGGQDAAPHSWPWQLSLQRSNSHSCGASLLNDRFAVTAAHCVENAAIGDLKIVAGAHGILESEPSRQEVSIADYIIHPDYSSSSLGYPNDVAVLVFSAPLTLTNEVQPVRLIDNNNDFAGASNCYITGWGRLQGGGLLPNILQEAPTSVISTSSCRSQLGLSGIFLNDAHVCVYTGNNGACNGDSGGPLVCDDGNGWLLIGATSWGLSDCPVNSPTVYARLSTFQAWIRGITGPL